MSLSERLAILISANGGQAVAEFNKVGKSAERALVTTEQKAQRVGTQLTRVGAGAVVFGAVVAAGMFKAAQAAEEQQMANLRLENTIAHQPALAGASADAFYDQASALQDVTRFGDEATVSAQAMLGQFGLTQDQILQLTPLVQDYAARTGTDLVTAARNVGKATAGTNTTLKRAGVGFDEAAYAADNFGQTVAALQTYAGGFAESEGRTMSGQLEILKNRFGEIAESVGGGAADAFSTFTGIVDSASGALDGMSEGSQHFIGQLGTYAAVSAVAGGGLLVLAGQGIKLMTTLRRVADTVTATRIQLALLEVGGAGFVGLAAGALAAGAAIAIFSKSQEHARDVQNFTEALKREEEGFAGATNEALAHVLATDGAINNYRELGISADTIVGAIRGESGAWDELKAAREAAEAVMGDNDLHDPAVEKNAEDVYHLVNAVDSQRGAYQEANQAQDDFNAALSATGGSAEEAAAAIDQLTQEIRDYLDGAFSVPSAQRDLRASFDGLFQTFVSGTGTADDYAASLEDIVSNAADVVSAQVETGASNREVAATIAYTRARLLEARDAGIITARQFRDYTAVLEGIPTGVNTPVTAPGAENSRAQLASVRDTANQIPRNVDVNVRVNTGNLIADVADATRALHDLRRAAGDESGRVTGGPSGARRSGASPVSSVVAAVGVAATEAAGGRVQHHHHYYPVMTEAQMMRNVQPDQRAKVRRRMLAGAV